MKSIIQLFIFFSFSLVFAQVEKIEPPFWWAGMQQTELEVLCYGNNLAQYDVSVSKGININQIKRTSNPNYLFITIDTKDVPAISFDIIFQKNNKTEYTYSYELKQRSKNSASRSGFDASDVIYLIMPDRFANGDSSNDSTSDTTEKANRDYNGGRHGGDLQGVIDHLDYLNDLGVTTIWSTPLLEDNEPVYSYHTYAQSDYYKVDPRYGTNDDYKRLASEMHDRDMKLIMDYVTNHWGSKHWIINDLPAEDWIHVWEDGEKGFKRSNYRMTTQFDPNASKIDALNCMNGWFDTTMPDMNQKNPLLLKYMIQNAIWWIEFAGLDGLRVDTYSYNDKESIAAWTKAIMDEYPNFNIVGEVWMHNQAEIAYWQKDSKIGALQDFNSNLPTVMDFTLYDAITSMFHENQGWNTGMQKAYDNFTNDFLYPDIDNIVVFAGNHDTNRINEIYKNDLPTFKLAMTLIFTVRGIPQIYYGDEIGMQGNKDAKGDGDIRRDFPGGWEGDPQNAFVESGRTETQNAYHSFVKNVLNWRKDKEVMHRGKFLQYLPQDDVYVYFRYNDTERVMIVLNNSDASKEIVLDRFSEGFQGTTAGVDIISGRYMEFSETLIIPAKTSMIIDLR